jgi:hypothetical protein
MGFHVGNGVDEVEPLEVPNLDAIEDDGALAELDNVFSRLAAYCEHKRQARKYRLAGDIECALSHERICDDHYKRLPEWAKW